LPRSLSPFPQGAQIPDFQSKQDLEIAESAANAVKLKTEKRSVLQQDDDGPAGATTLLVKAKPLLLTNDDVDTDRIASKYDDRDDEDDSDSDLDSSSSEEDDDDDDDDDEELLQRELEKIKKEREDARLKKEAEEEEIAMRDNGDDIMAGNPLMDASKRSSQVKRKWNDDVVFKNQARSEPEVKKRFVNDTIRNDFHRRFLSKYMK
jgi:protein CWC15